MSAGITYAVPEGIVYFCEGRYGWYDKEGNLIREISPEEADRLMNAEPNTAGA